jgi:serine protease Do
VQCGDNYDEHKSSLVDSVHAAEITPPVKQVALPQEDLWSNRRNAITKAVKLVSPAVVSVNVTAVREYIQRNPYYVDPAFRNLFPELFSDRKYLEKVKSLGSGFVISQDGYILTNEHVVENAVEVVVAFSNGSEFKAEIIGVDALSDIALLKVNSKNLPHIKFGNSKDVLIGEWAIAFGNPFGLFYKHQPTVTVGVISAVNRDFGKMVSNRIYQDMLQTDASINSGNSGGPLCNADGKVIGINTFIYSNNGKAGGSVGIGFAIPIHRVQKILKDLKLKHKVDRSYWTGMYYSNLNLYLAKELGYPKDKGVYIARIERGSPAQKAGVKLGDIIVKVYDKAITNFTDIENAVISVDPKVGEILKLTIWREHKLLDIKIVLEKQKGA